MKSRSVQNNFLSGELSPLVKGNVNLEQYYQGAETLENVVIVPQGGVKRRGGLEYLFSAKRKLNKVSEIPTMPNGGTASNITDENGLLGVTSIISSDEFVVASYDLGSERLISVIDVNGAFFNTDFESFLYIQYSSDNVSWSGLIRPYVKQDSSNNRFTPLISARYWRLIYLGNPLMALPAGTTVSIDSFVLYEEGDISKTKLVNISSDTTDGYAGVLSDYNLDIFRFRDNDQVLRMGSIKTPYSSNDIQLVRVAQSGSVTLFFHEDYPTQRLINYGDPFLNNGSNTNPVNGSLVYFNIDDAPYSNIPQYDFNDSLSPVPVDEIQVASFSGISAGTRYQIDIEGVLSKQITYAGDTNPDEQQATEFNLQKNLQEMPVFGDTGVFVNRTGAHEYTISISGESAKAFKLFSGFPTDGGGSISFSRSQVGSPRKEDLWSVNRGYPRLGAFHQGRLWLGGTRDIRQAIVASKSGDLLNFDLGEGDDDEAIFRTLSSNKGTNITDIFSGRNLLVFTEGEVYADLGEIVTPSTANLLKQSSTGSAFIPALDVDGAIIAPDRNGKTLREFVFTFNEDAYTPIDITVLSSHLIKNPVSTAYVSGTSSDDANWMFIVNEDGTAAILNKLRSQDINGFSKFTTQGNIKSCLVAGEDIYFAVEREIEGVASIFIERWSFNNRFDSSYLNRGAALVSELDDAEHLSRVDVRVNNISLPSRDLVDGSVVFTPEELQRYISQDSDVEVGLSFTPKVKSMPANTNGGSGSNFLRIKKILSMNIRVYETRALYIDGEPVPFRSLGTDTFDNNEAFTGIIDDKYLNAGFDRDYMPEITCPDPMPFHIQAIEYEVESS